MNSFRAVAIDLGAESCRVSLGEWNGSVAQVRLAHRFANHPVERGGHLYWGLEALWEGVNEGLRLAAQLPPLPGTQSRIDAIGVDGWAIDYVRLGEDGSALGDPFCYRDPRTETAMPELWTRVGTGLPTQAGAGAAEAGKKWIYSITGIQFLRINTVYQLFADRRDGLDPGRHWLNIPEYFLYRLAGCQPSHAVAEYTNATHTQLLEARTRDWADEIFARTGLDRAAAPRVVPPGSEIGPLAGPITALPAYRGTKLIAPACHDTGAAVAGIPDARDDWAFISSGTWSLVGAVIDEPCTSEAARHENFTNEGGIGGRIRFLKNVNGMWLLQECLREWQAAGGRTWTVQELVAACERLPGPEMVFNVDAAELLLPGDMPARINREIERTGHAPLDPSAAKAPAMADAIFWSLATRYAEVLKALQRVTGRHLRRLYIVGGANQNKRLNRMVAEATGLEVIRGAVESSTVGNLAVQFAALEAGSPVTPQSVAGWAERLLESKES
jgi:rhamnulokinase